jgi:hypothetical protein
MLAGARIGSYIGIVTDIPMPGQLVELNKQAWLLLTHPVRLRYIKLLPFSSSFFKIDIPKFSFSALA